MSINQETSTNVMIGANAKTVFIRMLIGCVEIFHNKFDNYNSRVSFFSSRSHSKYKIKRYKYNCHSLRYM